jgi:hypothetical protein
MSYMHGVKTGKFNYKGETYILENLRKLELGLIYWSAAILRKTKDEYLDSFIEDEDELSLANSIETWLGEFDYWIARHEENNEGALHERV